MLGVAGAGLGASVPFFRTAPFALGLIPHNGQSLSIGAASLGPWSTTQRWGNKKLFDSASTYDITNPNAGTLSLVPLVAPQRSLGSAGPYPANVAGEDASIAMANTIAWLASLYRYG